jgi:ribonuclease G
MKKILINDNIWQTRVAITKEGKLQNIYFASPVENPLERIFFKGTVIKVLPGIQTAFVDIGQEKAGFLHISEIDRELAISNLSKKVRLEGEEEKPRKIPHQKLDINSILKEGSTVLVQVSKEPVHEKGAKLTTCFTLPGRFVVLMPNIPRVGISKKIDDPKERARLKDIVKNNLPKGMGAIIRTTSDRQDEKTIAKDITYLVGIWNGIQERLKRAQSTERLYEDIELPLQIVRDHLDESVEEIIVDDKPVQKKVYNFIKSIAPEFTQKIQYYSGPIPLFEHYDIEKQIKTALQKKVFLKSGGSLIIESTEAMTVIDVNTGKFIGKKSLEDTILKTNLEAAQETVRQLKLRNIGGLIVIDFIDMASGANKQKLSQYFEKTLREEDKFQSVVLRVSEFGIVQMTRKRSGKTLVQQLTVPCPTCLGAGFISSVQTESYTILRALEEDLRKEKIKNSISLEISSPAFKYITAVEYDAIFKLEQLYHVKITLISKPLFSSIQYKIIKK